MKSAPTLTLLALLSLTPALGVAQEQASSEANEAQTSSPKVVMQDSVVVTAAPLPKYRVETNDSGTLVDLPPEKAPFTVDTLTEDFIRERNVTDLDQLLSLQPGIFQGGKTVMARQAGTYSIRGFSGSEVLLNGVPLNGGIGTFFDPALLERVDIVKGPVGAAYGAQSGTMADAMGAGGSILLQTKRASFEEDFYDFLIKGSYSRVSGSRLKVAADINQVLIEEGAAVRVPFAYEWREPGWASSKAHNGTSISVAPSMAFKVTDRLEAGLDLFYQYSDQPAYQGVRIRDGKPYGSGWDDTYTRDRDRMKFEVFGATFRLDGDVTDWLTLRTRASYMQTHNRYDYRGPYSTTPFSTDPTSGSHYEWGAGDRTFRTYYAGQDAIFKFGTAGVEHQFLVGVNTTIKDSRGWGGFESSGVTEETYLAAIKADGSERTRQHKVGIQAQEVASWNGLTLLAGVRGDWHDSVKHEHLWAVSPRAGISYDVAEANRVIFFGNVSYSKNPNFNCKSLDRKNDYLDSTWRALQREVGVRVAPVEGFWISATHFYITQSNVPEQYGRTEYYTDGGKNESKGWELSASGNITENWSAYLAYTYIYYYDVDDADHYDKFPPHSASLWTSYKMPFFYDAVFGFGARWRDGWLLTFRGNKVDESVEPGQYAKSLLTFDTSLDFPISDNMSLGFALRNIFDTRGVESARNLQAFANDGRTFEVSFRMTF